MSDQQHWDAAYAKTPEQLSWTQSEPTRSLALISEAAPTGRVIDIGGGDSRLAELLLDRGYQPTVLDISPKAIERAQAHLGDRAAQVNWIVGDITADLALGSFDIWHDRATFHFLTEPAQRAVYIATLLRSLKTGGHAILATFAPDGPEKCSGLPVCRYDGESLARELGSRLQRIKTVPELHHTPWGAPQSFQYSLFRRI